MRLSLQSSTSPWKGREEGGRKGEERGRRREGEGAEVSGGHPLSEETPPTPRRRVFCVLLNSDKLGKDTVWERRGSCGAGLGSLGQVRPLEAQQLPTWQLDALTGGLVDEPAACTGPGQGRQPVPGPHGASRIHWSLSRTQTGSGQARGLQSASSCSVSLKSSQIA